MPTVIKSLKGLYDPRSPNIQALVFTRRPSNEQFDSRLIHYMHMHNIGIRKILCRPSCSRFLIIWGRFCSFCKHLVQVLCIPITFNNPIKAYFFLIIHTLHALFLLDFNRYKCSACRHLG